ncbi:hypothetical protein [Methylocapsa sp. S129]|uniref:hypothetical protein n=1 Tax=Methylocapsa sp. S129 TaxID=1641869 RepID=UPI00131DCD1F|nr:hypothetical protein [Methylocapsa sp. S129]
MTPVLILIALAASVPNADPHRICQDARTAALPEDKSSAFDSCVHDEQAAREQLQKKWTQFSVNARATCAEPGALMTSYVEMLTCLEMQSGADFGTAKVPSPDVAAPANPAAPNAAGQKP